jgi:hypothetical protein
MLSSPLPGQETVGNASFSSFYYTGFNYADGTPSAGKKSVAVRQKVIEQRRGVVKDMVDSGAGVVTYLWVGGFDRRYHDQASAEKFKGEFAGPPPAWVREVKDYVRACYNNPNWIEEIVDDVVVQMEEGDSEGIFFDVTAPLNHCICKHCRRRLKEETGLDLDSMPMPAFSEPALDQTSGEDGGNRPTGTISRGAWRRSWISSGRCVRRSRSVSAGVRCS